MDYANSVVRSLDGRFADLDDGIAKLQSAEIRKFLSQSEGNLDQNQMENQWPTEINAMLKTARYLRFLHRNGLCAG